MSRITKLFANLFILLVAVVVSLIILEMGSRMLLTRKSEFEIKYDPLKVRVPYPHIMFKGKPNELGHNHLGYPGKSADIPKEKGEFRIFFIGGSTVYGGNPSIAELVERYYHKAGMNFVKTFNYGVVSSASGEDLARFVYEVLDYQPDMVIFYNGGNDIIQTSIFDPRPGYPLDYFYYENNPFLHRGESGNTDLWFIAQKSHLFRYLFHNLINDKLFRKRELRKSVHHLSPEWEDAVAYTYVNNMFKASKIAKGYNIKAITLFQPTICFKDKAYLTEIEKPNYLEKSCPMELSLRERIIKRAAEFKKKDPDFLFYDLSMQFHKDTRTIFGDRIHVSQGAKGVLARIMFVIINRVMGAELKK